MARPREFDADTALQRALEVFWQKGYEAASMQDLVQAMGIQKASLYNTFGDKHSLYLAALARYQQAALDRLTKQLAGSASPMAAIRRFVADVVDNAAGRAGRHGCFCINAAAELAPSDPEVAQQLRLHHGRMEELLAATLQRAKAQRELPASADTERLAVFVLGLVVAINLLGKQRTEPDKLRMLAEFGLQALPH
jgi:TetR/AcrR family transcriptional regulator, transcriptional repressor for nem operon